MWEAKSPTSKHSYYVEDESSSNKRVRTNESEPIQHEPMIRSRNASDDESDSIKRQRNRTQHNNEVRVSQEMDKFQAEEDEALIKEYNAVLEKIKKRFRNDNYNKKSKIDQEILRSIEKSDVEEIYRDTENIQKYGLYVYLMEKQILSAAERQVCVTQEAHDILETQSRYDL